MNIKPWTFTRKFKEISLSAVLFDSFAFLSVVVFARYSSLFQLTRHISCTEILINDQLATVNIKTNMSVEYSWTKGYRKFTDAHQCPQNRQTMPCLLIKQSVYRLSCCWLTNAHGQCPKNSYRHCIGQTKTAICTISLISNGYFRN